MPLSLINGSITQKLAIKLISDKKLAEYFSTRLLPYSAAIEAALISLIIRSTVTRSVGKSTVSVLKAMAVSTRKYW